MELLKEYLIPWLISNSIAIIILVSAFKKPKLARLIFILLFLWAFWINYNTAHKNPNEYLNYAALSPYDLYSTFINGWFKSHITSMVSLIAFGQALIALGMLLKGLVLRISCFGAIIFFIAISPLGIGSAFPFPIICLLAIYFILKNDDLNYLWFYKKKKSNVSNLQ